MRIQMGPLVLLAVFACNSPLPGNTLQGSGGEPGATDECRGPGRYEAGKEGSYRPCCPGLTEVLYQSAGYVDGVPGCWSPPMRVYACVSGTCGDGICEIGEAPSCGCVADCPDAAWGPQDGGTPMDGDSTN
jgi:hypothetical protein